MFSSRPWGLWYNTWCGCRAEVFSHYRPSTLHGLPSFSSTSWAWENVNFSWALCPKCRKLTSKHLFVAELLFAPSAAQKLWDKDSPVQSSVFLVGYLPPRVLIRLLRNVLCTYARVKWVLSEPNLFSYLLMFSPHLDLLFRAAMPSAVALCSP